MNSFAKYHFLYNSFFSKALRAILYLLLPALTILGVFKNIYPNIFFTPLFLYIIFDIYFSQKINKIEPKLEVSKNSSNPLDSFSIQALGVFVSKKNTESLIKYLMNLSQVDFMLNKMNIVEKEVEILNLDKNSIATKAFEIAKKMEFKHISTMDLFCAYLLLTEKDTKLLFNKKLRESDLENILVWATKVYLKEEELLAPKVSYAGEGIAEDWVYGWTIETQKYLTDLSREFLKSDKEPVGRESEYAQMIEALYKGSSVILVGDAGSGKETLVKKLAIDSFIGKLREKLLHQKIMQLMVDAFMAGAQNQGEIEERLNLLMQELSHSGNVIMYIPEFQNILGNESFHLDISGGILPYVNKGQIRIIAAVTPGAFKKFIEPLHTLLEGFTVIEIGQPSEKEVLDMLYLKTLEIEKRHKVNISYKAILACFKYAPNYSKQKVLPGSAIVLLEDSANSVALSHRKIVEEKDIYDQVKKIVKVDVGEPQAVEKTLLLNLETELHKRIIGQNYAVSAISEAIRRVRAGLKSSNKPISFLFLGPTGVGKTETAKALANVYFGEGSRMVRLDMSEFVGEDGIKKLLGSSEGGGESGVLTEAVYDNPYSMVLLDEFEKADKKILDLFLQVFDDGRLTDGKGKTVSFVNTIIIATSNAGSEFIRERLAKKVEVDKNFKDILMNDLQTKGVFKPELLNRFDDIVVFNPLSQTEIYQVVKLLLAEFIKTMDTKDINLNFDDKVIQKIASEGFDREFGARPIRRFIADKIEDLIAQKMLKDEIKRGDSVRLILDSTGNIGLGSQQSS